MNRSRRVGQLRHIGDTVEIGRAYRVDATLKPGQWLVLTPDGTIEVRGCTDTAGQRYHGTIEVTMA